MEWMYIGNMCEIACSAWYITQFALLNFHCIWSLTQLIGVHFLYFSLFFAKKCAMVTWQKCIHSFYPNNNIATVLNSLSTNIKSWFQCSKWCDLQWNMARINRKTIWLQPQQEYDTSKKKKKKKKFTRSPLTGLFEND